LLVKIINRIFSGQSKNFTIPRGPGHLIFVLDHILNTKSRFWMAGNIPDDPETTPSGESRSLIEPRDPGYGIAIRTPTEIRSNAKKLIVPKE
jgi:hypothetical protein